MPTWAIVLSSVMTIIIILGGAVSFPYVPMFFGVYDAERYSLRGKFIVKLIWLFPLASLIFLYIAWTSNGLFALAPFAYLAFVWSIRANKGDSAGPGMQFSSKQQNLKASLDELEYRWESWQNNKPTNNYLLFSFFAPSVELAKPLKDIISKTEKLHSEIEESNYDNKSLTLHARIKLDSIDKNTITETTKRMIDAAWNNNCELSSLDVMEDE